MWICRNRIKNDGKRKMTNYIDKKYKIKFIRELRIRKFQCFFDLLLSIENPFEPLKIFIRWLNVYSLVLLTEQCHSTEIQPNLIFSIETSKHFIIPFIESFIIGVWINKRFFIPLSHPIIISKVSVCEYQSNYDGLGAQTWKSQAEDCCEW